MWTASFYYIPVFTFNWLLLVRGIWKDFTCFQNTACGPIKKKLEVMTYLFLKICPVEEWLGECLCDRCSPDHLLVSKTQRSEYLCFGQRNNQRWFRQNWLRKMWHTGFAFSFSLLFLSSFSHFFPHCLNTCFTLGLDWDVSQNIKLVLKYRQLQQMWDRSAWCLRHLDRKQEEILI